MQSLRPKTLIKNISRHVSKLPLTPVRAPQPPRVGGVKVYSDNIQRSEIIMDLEIFYAGDSRIECSFSRMTAGIKDFQVG